MGSIGTNLPVAAGDPLERVGERQGASSNGGQQFPSLSYTTVHRHDKAVVASASDIHGFVVIARKEHEAVAILFSLIHRVRIDHPSHVPSFLHTNTISFGVFATHGALGAMMRV